MEETASTVDSNTPKSDGRGSRVGHDSILLTKLNPPLLRSDIVARPQIIERLERDVRRPLTLISAPAGYGKSTIAAQWLQSSTLPGMWLSLDEGDNDLRIFLRYFVAAVRRHAPKGCRDTNDLLNSTDLPSPNRRRIFAATSSTSRQQRVISSLDMRAIIGCMEKPDPDSNIKASRYVGIRV